MSKNLKALAAVGAAVVAMSVVITTQAQGAVTLVVGSDLPLQGASKAQSEDTIKVMKLVLKQAGNKAGKYNIALKSYDDSTAAKGGWDDAQCAANAQAHVANRNEVAVMGTYNSGCAKIILPVLNQDPKGPMLMISNANTNPGLTKAWNPGEPEKYYPTGKRNYFRVITTDDYQGSAAAQFAQSLGVKKVYVLNDGQTYGQGVAQAFTTEANKLGMTVLSAGPYGEAWDAKQSNYEATFTKIKGLGPDMVYFGGLYDNNGGQLVKDKVKILGKNDGPIKLMTPDGFGGYPDLQKDPNADKMYLSFSGISMTGFPKGGAAEKFLADFKKAYGAEPVGSYAVYGGAAMQAILDAISRSNGTRVDVYKKAASIKIPAAKSVIGSTITFDSKGDVFKHEITIQTLINQTETDLKVISVK